MKTLFIVSNVSLIDEGALGTESPSWVYTDSVPIPGMYSGLPPITLDLTPTLLSDGEEDMGIRIRPATHHKCPRCWTYTRPENDELCKRCAEVVEMSVIGGV